MTLPLVVIGTVLQVPTPDRLEVQHDVAVVVAADGSIVSVVPSASEQASAACRHAIDAGGEVVVLDSHQRLLPGLVDLHVHAPQWPQLGTGLDLELDEWLFRRTFPLEARFADTALARAVWDDLVPTLLAHGTTTAVYFSSIHEEATASLAETCARHGQRAFVGRVAMDHPEGTPPWYRDADAGAGVDATARSIRLIEGLGTPLVRPIITPRFVPACTDELLAGLGRLAADTGVLVQTHCSESAWEHGHVLERCGATDTTVLDRSGLLRPGTVLAHGTHLTDADLGRIAANHAGIAHCPISNTYFAGAVFGVARARRHGVAVGMGSDIAGGFEPGLLAQCTAAVTASRTLGSDDDRIDVVAAFHAATVGGADLVGAPVGLLAPGRQFDAMVVDLAARSAGLRAWDGLDDEARIFEKIVRLGGPTDITTVWVAGRPVVTRTDTTETRRRRSPLVPFAW